jgi:ring-1,2-phenylacetyl-CoA epoxidase subunit PaaB
MPYLHTFEVFRQKAPGDAHVHVGEVEAPDAEAAMLLAKEHFARREACCSLWVADRRQVLRSQWEPEVFDAGRAKAYRRSGGLRAASAAAPAATAAAAPGTAPGAPA